MLLAGTDVAPGEGTTLVNEIDEPLMEVLPGLPPGMLERL